MQSRPARLSRTRSSASTTTTRSWPRLGRGRVSMPRDRGARRAARAERTIGRCRATSAERSRADLRHRVADRSSDRTERRRRRRRAAGDRAPSGTTTSIRGALAGRRSRREKRAPILSARARIPARPRWPSGTRAGSKPLPSSLDAEPDAARGAPDLEPDLAGRRVLDDVVERLLGDPVEDLLDRERQPLLERALDDDRQADPALERGRVGPQRRGPARPARGCRGAARR